MTEKKLSKMRRSELLKLMLEQQKQIRQLEDELAQANEKLASRRTNLKNAGSIAEASLALTNIFEEAQKAADGYLENLKDMKDDEDEEDDPDPPLSQEAKPDLPSVEALEAVLEQQRYQRRLRRMIKNTVFSLVTVAAAAVLVAVLMLPVLRMYGTSMSPSLTEGDYVVCFKGGGMQTGDIVAFYYNNKVLVKRVIAQAGQWVDIGEDGTVYVDNMPIDEPYLVEGAKAFGECNITLPYQVPDARVFVMGDNRESSVDSRSTTVGCVSEEQLVGHIVFRIWPLDKIGEIP